jgi:hypothetical protein
VFAQKYLKIHSQSTFFVSFTSIVPPLDSHAQGLGGWGWEIEEGGFSVEATFKQQHLFTVAV